MTNHKHVSLNLNVRGMGQSATLAINERCRQLRSQGRHVFNFGLGQSPFPVPDSIVEALRAAAPNKDYLPVMGLPELRSAVADFHRKHDLFDAQAEGVIIGPGSKELMFLVQLCYYGEIIVTPPCWVSYLPQARIIGRRVSMIESDYKNHWKITAAQLRKSLEIVGDHRRPRLMVLNYPSNPTGQSYTTNELSEIAEVAREFEIIILSDEIYGELHYRGEHVSIARFYPEGTIVSSGLSKWCGAGGWRLGTFHFPPDLFWLLEALAAVASETYTSVSAPIQSAAVRAFRGGVDIERYLWHARRILETLSRQCVDLLHDAGVDVHMPAGSFYLYLDFAPFRAKLAERGIENGQQLSERMLEEAGAAFLPGVAFVQSSDSLAARTALVDFDGAAALAASETIPLHEKLPDQFTRHYCGRVLEGIERICDWITSI